MESVYKKVMDDIISGNDKRFESLFGTAQNNFIISILQAVQELAEAEMQKAREPQQTGTVVVDKFYKDIPKEEAAALIEEIIERVENTRIAMKLARMFKSNRIPVDRVERLLSYDWA